MIKTLLYSLFICSLVVLVSCDKDYQGDSYDFSNVANPYVQVKTAKTTVAQGKSLSIAVTMRTAIAGATTVNYKLEGAMTGTGSITIPVNTLEGSTSLVIPVGTVPSGSSSAKITLTLTSATNSLLPLTIGWNNTGKSEVITVTP